MANKSPSTSVTVEARTPARNKFLIIAAGPILLLVVAMAGMRLLPNDDIEDRLPKKHRHHPPVDVAVTPVKRPPLDIATQQELKKTIQAQLDAFRRDDYVAASRLATPAFQERVKPEQFRSMVLHEYPALAHPVRTYFRNPQNLGSGAGYFVVVQDASGAQEGFFYQLTKVDSNWRVSTCVPAHMAGSFAPPMAAHFEGEMMERTQRPIRASIPSN